ncbi:MAG TPA: MBL fold metallo-hydrolase [Terriglobia bacterium]|nr:MBL fold metallo-hydrolase [Terriglobia bacterium]
MKKARTGLKLSVGDVARLTGLPGADITALERGDQLRDRTELRAISTALGLRLAALEQIALEKWVPKTLPLMPGIETVLGEISGYGVKGYIVHDSGEAVLVDTAYNADMMLEILEARRLRLVGICLTHGHADHAEGIHQIVSRWPVPIYLGTEDVTLLHWKPSEQQRATPHDGRIIQVGRLAIKCLTTPGHTPGGVCYRLEMPWGPVAFVGDTLFAGSIGRSNPPGLYATHLESVRRDVLTLPADCLLLPGHGPGTTVREELDHNPFYVS